MQSSTASWIPRISWKVMSRDPTEITSAVIMESKGQGHTLGLNRGSVVFNTASNMEATGRYT